MKKYVLHWWYFDGSGRGVLPMIFTEDQRGLVNEVLKALGDWSSKEWNFVEVAEATSL